jgi:diguanylate cyclase (GGDEF)-like protein
MNGLKAINDQHDHAVGDVAIKTYLQTIASLIGDKAEAFRSGGSDEVVVVMRDTRGTTAHDVMRAVLQQLGKEPVRQGGRDIVPCLTASCGLVTTADAATDAAGLVHRADLEQKRAKQASKVEPGASFLAMEGGRVEKLSTGSRPAIR